MSIVEESFAYLDAPVERIAGADVTMPYAANLERMALPQLMILSGQQRGPVTDLFLWMLQLSFYFQRCLLPTRQWALTLTKLLAVEPVPLGAAYRSDRGCASEPAAAAAGSAGACRRAPPGTMDSALATPSSLPVATGPNALELNPIQCPQRIPISVFATCLFIVLGGLVLRRMVSKDV